MHGETKSHVWEDHRCAAYAEIAARALAHQLSRRYGVCPSRLETRKALEATDGTHQAASRVGSDVEIDVFQHRYV